MSVTGIGKNQSADTISELAHIMQKNRMKNLKRGVTYLNGEGAYSGNDKKVIMCAVRPQEVYKITSGIKNVDPNAFIIVTTAGAIKGRGFVNIDSN